MIKKFFVDLFLILAVVMLLYVRYINITLYGVRPDILLVFITLIALFEGDSLHSIFLGFFGGLVMDFMSGSTPLGFNAGIYLLIGYVGGRSSDLKRLQDQLSTTTTPHQLQPLLPGF